MKQEDKELLLKDLCARTPYGVKFACNKNVYTAKGIDSIVTDESDWEYAVTAKGIVPIEIDLIKPYLFPLSSMTEEQRREYTRAQCDDGDIVFSCAKEYVEKGADLVSAEYHATDWLNAHHFDYRGLIPKGLAIDASGLSIY